MHDVAENAVPQGASLEKRDANDQTRGQAHLSESFSQALGKHRTLHRAIASVGELVEYIKQDTGWNVDLSKLDFQVVSREQITKIMSDEIGVRLGYTPAEWSQLGVKLGAQDGLWGKFHNWLAVRAVGATLGGLFLPSTGGVVFVEDNLAWFNEQGLRKILYHELVHAGQMQRYPEFFGGVSSSMRRGLELKLLGGAKGDDYLNAMDTVNARMAWIEGQPTYLQELRAAERYPGAKITASLGTRALGILSLAMGGTTQKIGQYIRGRKVFAQLYESEIERGFIDTVFKKPELADLMLKTRGEITFKFKGDGTKEENLKVLKAMISHFSAKNTQGGVNLQVHVVNVEGDERQIHDAGGNTEVT